MSSPWGKFLAEIVVPAGGWDWSWTDPAAQLVTIPAGRYDSILDLCSELSAQIVAAGRVPTITVSSVGQVRIYIINGMVQMTGIVWAACSDDLSDAMGYDETEAVVAGAVVATERHRWGWYPGVIGRGDADGEGLASDSGWQVSDSVGSVVAGSGRARLIAPARRLYRRVVRFGSIRRTEALDRLRGPVCLQDLWSTGTLDWYVDRDYGTVAFLESQRDPGYPHWDSDIAYARWKVTISRVTLTPVEGPTWWNVEIHMEAEPR